ncbi:MAG: glycosyltransferase family 25 protein [Acidobacteriota bacterium]
MHQPFDFFDDIVCINLDNRPDRWREASAEFARVGLDDRVRRVSAVIPPTGDGSLGCKLSHLDILSDAFERGLESVLIFEDDVTFTPDAIEVLGRALAELPKRWDMLYFGIMLFERPSYRSRHLVEVHSGYESHAYAVHRRAMKMILDRTSRDRYQPHRVYDDAIDRFYSEQIHPRTHSLCVRPMICHQRPGWSDIEQRHDDHSPYWEQSEKLFEALDRTRQSLGPRAVALLRRRWMNRRRRIFWRTCEALLRTAPKGR